MTPDIDPTGPLDEPAEAYPARIKAVKWALVAAACLGGMAIALTLVYALAR